MQICEVHADRSRLEHAPVVVLDDRNACQRVTRQVLRAVPLLVGHDLEVIWLPELLERPCHADRPTGVLAVKDADHGVGTIAWSQRSTSWQLATRPKRGQRPQLALGAKTGRA